MRPIYITGHKNPDTDTIISSIAYAEYKKMHGVEAIASRIGPVDSATESILNKFGFDDPLHIYTAKSTVREIDFDEAVLVNPELTIKEALDKISKIKSKTLYVSNRKRELLGVVTISTISEIWLADNKKLIKIMKDASLKNIIKTLKAKIIYESPSYKTNGEVILSPANDVIFKPGSIIITSSIRKIEFAVKHKAGLLIVLDGMEVNEKVLELAKENNVTIIASPLTALGVSKNIYISGSIASIMQEGEEIVKIKDSLTTDEATEIIANLRFRAYPIIDGHNKIIGSLSRYHLFNYKKKKLILVDHNEKKQSIDDIEYGEVVEIVDHHRFGGFESENPISITTQIVGATCTIIASKFFDEKLKISKKLAGLLLSGIVADTMNFKSPTTTKIDKEVANKLEKISGVKSDDIQKMILESSESLKSKRVRDIVYDDFKEFDLGESKVGLSQAICKSYEDYKAIRTQVSQFLEDICAIGEYDLMVIMLTDPNGSGSYLIYSGRKQEIIQQVFPKMGSNHFVNHLISRKKQLLPVLIDKLGK